MLAIMFFFTLLAFASVAVGAYIFAVWTVRNRPESPLGQILAPIFSQYASQGRHEAEATQQKIRRVATTPAAETRTQKRFSFRALQAPNDSVVVTFPDSGETLTLRVVGSMQTVELYQEDQSRRTNPWTINPHQRAEYVFQILEGRRRAWIFEAPGGVLALVRDIDPVDANSIERVFVRSAKAFGASNQEATDISVTWQNREYLLYDIGRLGPFESKGEAPWNAAPEKYDPEPWPDRYQLKFILAGPKGGKYAPHEAGDEFLAVITPVTGNSGYVLTGTLIDETYLKDVREEG